MTDTERQRGRLGPPLSSAAHILISSPPSTHTQRHRPTTILTLSSPAPSSLSAPPTLTILTPSPHLDSEGLERCRQIAA